MFNIYVHNDLVYLICVSMYHDLSLEVALLNLNAPHSLCLLQNLLKESHHIYKPLNTEKCTHNFDHYHVSMLVHHHVVH